MNDTLTPKSLLLFKLGTNSFEIDLSILLKNYENFKRLYVVNPLMIRHLKIMPYMIQKIVGLKTHGIREWSEIIRGGGEGCKF